MQQRTASGRKKEKNNNKTLEPRGGRPVCDPFSIITWLHPARQLGFDSHQAGCRFIFSFVIDFQNSIPLFYPVFLFEGDGKTGVPSVYLWLQLHSSVQCELFLFIFFEHVCVSVPTHTHSVCSVV